MLERIPQTIADRVSRLTKSNVIPIFAELRRPGKPSRWKLFERLTVGDCEQLAEYHARRARRMMMRFDITGSPHTAKTAAEHVYRARLYRLLYQHLMAVERNEGDTAFPMLSDTQAAKIDSGQEGQGNAD
jgi:hypothetical protein